MYFCGLNRVVLADQNWSWVYRPAQIFCRLSRFRGKAKSHPPRWHQKYEPFLEIWDYLCPIFHCRINGSYQQQQHPVVSRKYSPSSSGGSSSVAATAAVVASGRSSVVDAPPPLPPPRGGAATHSQPPPTPPRGTTPPPSSSNAMSEWLILSYMSMTYLMNFLFA